MGPVLILATLFSLVENWLGHHVTFEKEWKEWDAKCQEGRSLVPLEGQGYITVVSGLNCPCLQL